MNKENLCESRQGGRRDKIGVQLDHVGKGGEITGSHPVF